jgi:hypothetical protein
MQLSASSSARERRAGHGDPPDRPAQVEHGWFLMMLKASETGLIAASELALARSDPTEEQHAQELECSFDAAVIGSYYGKHLIKAELDKRIGPGRLFFYRSTLRRNMPEMRVARR